MALDVNVRIGRAQLQDKNGNIVNPATEDTLSAINSKIVKCDTDNIKIVGPLSANGNVNININEDSVGLAKESTLSSINSKIVKCDTDNVKIVSPVTANGNVATAIVEDTVGLAKDSTLQSILSELQTTKEPKVIEIYEQLTTPPAHFLYSPDMTFDATNGAQLDSDNDIIYIADDVLAIDVQVDVMVPEATNSSNIILSATYDSSNRYYFNIVDDGTTLYIKVYSEENGTVTEIASYTASFGTYYTIRMVMLPFNTKHYALFYVNSTPLVKTSRPLDPAKKISVALGGWYGLGYAKNLKVRIIK